MAEHLHKEANGKHGTVAKTQHGKVIRWETRCCALLQMGNKWLEHKRKMKPKKLLTDFLLQLLIIRQHRDVPSRGRKDGTGGGTVRSLFQQLQLVRKILFRSIGKVQSQ